MLPAFGFICSARAFHKQIRRQPRDRKGPAAAKGGVLQQPGGRPTRTAVLPLNDCRAAFPASPNAGGDRRERTGALPKRASAFLDSAGRSSPAGGKQSEKRARLSAGRRPCRDAQRGRRNLIGEGAPQAGAYEALSAKRARGTRSPSPRSPPKRVERSPLQTSRRNLPVTLSAQRATSDGVPAATIRPPASPPPGPISRI